MNGIKRWKTRQSALNIQAPLASAVSAARGTNIDEGEIHDPFLIKDMEKAVEIIKSAYIRAESPI